MDEEAEENSWALILSDLQQRSQTSESCRVLVLGGPSCGKSSLVSKFSNFHTHATPSYFASYGYLDVTSAEDNEDVVSRLNIWVSSLPSPNPDLLTNIFQSVFVSSCTSLSNSSILLCIDLSKPWSALSELVSWFSALESSSQSFLESLSEDDRTTLQNNISSQLQFYVNPNESDLTSIREEDREHIALETSNPPRNLGIPITVVGCKVDAFEKQQSRSDLTERFEVLTYYMRKVCLEYGASLCFTSASGTNVGLLQRHLEHRFFKTEFSDQPTVMAGESSSVFIPSGYDSGDLLESTSRHQRVQVECKEGISPLQQSVREFASIFPAPEHSGTSDGSFATRVETSVEAEKDDLFLKKFQFDLSQGVERGGRSSKAGGLSKPRRRPAAAASTLASRALGPGGASKQSQETVKNFFQSLLSTNSSSGKSKQALDAIRRSGSTPKSGSSGSSK